MDDYVEDNMTINVVPTRIVLESSDTYSIRTVIDILAKFVNVFTIKYMENGIKITEANQKKCTIIDYVLYDDCLLKYIFDMKDINGNNVKIYSTKSTPQEFLTTIKSISKKDNKLKTFIDVETDRSNNGIKVKMPDTGGYDTIRTSGYRDQLEDYIDYYDKEYINTRPQAKLTLAAFSNMIKRYKNKKCLVLNFILCIDDKVFVYGKRNQDIIIPNYIESIETDSNGSDNTIDIPQYKHIISINFNENSWLAKLSCLSPTSILQIYIKEDNPLVLRAPISTQGHATFAFATDSSIKKS